MCMGHLSLRRDESHWSAFFDRDWRDQDREWIQSRGLESRSLSTDHLAAFLDHLAPDMGREKVEFAFQAHRRAYRVPFLTIREFIRSLA